MQPLVARRGKKAFAAQAHAARAAHRARDAAAVTKSLEGAVKAYAKAEKAVNTTPICADAEILRL